MKNPNYDGSISFGHTLQSLPDAKKYVCEPPTILASIRANLQTPALVSEREPMYVHLPQFWDARSRSSACREVVSAVDVCEAVAARDHFLLAAPSGVDAEVKSDCSTADTADCSPGSPELEQARPRIMQRQNPDGLLLSKGSLKHDLGKCTPCHFFQRKQGCASGAKCRFCHLHEDMRDRPDKRKRERARKIVDNWEQQDCSPQVKGEMAARLAVKDSYTRMLVERRMKEMVEAQPFFQMATK